MSTSRGRRIAGRAARELLETLLAWEFQRLIGTEQISALRAWGSIASNKARVSAIMAAADVVLKDDELAHHRRCMDDVSLLSGTRNLVAHGMVYFNEGESWVSVDARSAQRHDVPHALGPAYYSTNKMKDGAFYLFSKPQLDDIAAEIRKLHARVSALRNGEYHRFFRVSMK